MKRKIIRCIPNIALFKAAQTGSRCTGSNWYPTGLFQGSEYANKLKAFYREKVCYSVLLNMQ